MIISKIWGIFTVTSQSAQAFFLEILMQLKNKEPSNHKFKKQQVQYSVPGPRPVLAAPLRPHYVPAAGGSSAEVTDLSEPQVPGLCPAAECKSTAGCIKTSQSQWWFEPEKEVCLPQTKAAWALPCHCKSCSPDPHDQHWGLARERLFSCGKHKGGHTSCACNELTKTIQTPN